MQDILRIVIVAGYFGLGWAAGSSRLFQEREYGCSSVVALVALLGGVAVVVWATLSGLPWWWATAALAEAALIVGGVAGGLRKRY